MQPFVRDWLDHRAAVSPHKLALLVDSRRWTFAELDAAATLAALRLSKAGVRPGDRVASLLHNGAGPVVLVHAALRLGATLVPLNVRLSAEELAWQIGDAGPRVVVVEERTGGRIAGAGNPVPSVEIAALLVGENASLGQRDEHASPAQADERASLAQADTRASSAEAAGQPISPVALLHDPAHVLAIIYTSGTTGRPKAAQLTVGNFWWSAIGSALNLGIDPDDRWLAVLPLFHVGGLSVAIRSAIYGTAIVVHDGFDPDDVNRALDSDGVTLVSVVSTMLRRMLEDRGDRPYLSRLRCVLLGGGPAPPTLLQRCAALNVPVAQTYGLTEACSQVATLTPAEGLRKAGAAGHPLYPNEVRIARADGSTAAADEAGEILVRGPIVMAGYAGQPDATARAIVDGWLHTGDIGSLDAEGFLYVHERRDDLIITGGENVYPAEVEAALLAHPLVAEAAVVGLPDDQWGQRVVAVVRLVDSPPARNSGKSPTGGTEVLAALEAHCRALIAGYKVPREIRIVTDPLPRTASGKLQRAALRNDRH